MNKSGFVFTLDATLSLIPIFILLVSASSLAPSTGYGTIRQMRMAQFGQDSLTVLSDRLGNASTPLESYLNTSSTVSIDNFLNNTTTQWNYMIQMNTTSGWTYVVGKNGSNYDQNDVNTAYGDASDVAVDSKVVTNVTEGNSTLHLFRMYVWG